MNDRSHYRIGSGAWLAIAVAAGIGVALVVFRWPDARSHWQLSYLIAWLTWTAVSLGSISILLLHNLTGGQWGEAIRPIAHAAAKVIVLMGILFVPIALDLSSLYPWTNQSLVAEHPILQHKQPYLNTTFFLVRSALYFVIWVGILRLLAWHEHHRAATDQTTILRMRRFSGQALVLHGLATTFAAIDWMMSLEPEWFSTIYGVLIFVAQGLAAFAFAVLIVCGWSAKLQLVVDVDARHDLGKLLLAFVMLWAYMSFSQFLIIWYGNLPEEVVWYMRRLDGAWQWVALALVVFKFAVPFTLLLGRESKRSPLRLGAIAGCLLLMSWMEYVWLVAPALQPFDQFAWLLDIGLVLIGAALWCGAFALNLAFSPIPHASSEASHG